MRQQHTGLLFDSREHVNTHRYLNGFTTVTSFCVDKVLYSSWLEEPIKSVVRV